MQVTNCIAQQKLLTKLGKYQNWQVQFTNCSSNAGLYIILQYVSNSYSWTNMQVHDPEYLIHLVKKEKTIWVWSAGSKSQCLQNFDEEYQYQLSTEYVELQH